MGLIEKVWRNAIFLRSALRTLKRLKPITPDAALTVPDLIEEWVDKRPDNIAIYYQDREISYRAFDENMNRYARWAQAQGLGRGDVVALMMENRPEYLMAWMGLAKIGVVGALINTHIQSQALAHCLSVTGARYLILGTECLDRFSSARPLMNTPLEVWATGEGEKGADADDLDAALAAQSGAPIDRSVRAGMTAKETCLYIFTSGTTGLPKAARLSHLRVASMMIGFSAATNAKETDRMYVTLPLYHSSGGVVAIGTTLTAGGAVIIKRRFSVTDFWEDCVRYRATMFQYIGELCRYLLNAPVSPHERRHRIRMCVGNGLRPDIWEEFKARFKLPKILEFYGATEGNVALFNYDGKPGAVGRVPFFMAKRYHYTIVKFDVETESPIRGSDGFCIEAEIDEVGEILGEISEDPRQRFEGYSTRAETEKKILRDVYKKGDAWFRTGDLMKRDADGYYYFIDRIGDTFRWKGENVSTTEVAEVLSVFPGVREVNVYGVKVAKADGRAGMAAIVAEDTLDLAALHAYLEKELPDYARPLFLRLLPQIEVTGTFKHRKVDLVKDGFDPSRTEDAIYFDDPEENAYVRLDSERYEKICAGAYRF